MRVLALASVLVLAGAASAAGVLHASPSTGSSGGAATATAASGGEGAHAVQADPSSTSSSTASSSGSASTTPSHCHGSSSGGSSSSGSGSQPQPGPSWSCAPPSDPAFHARVDLRDAEPGVVLLAYQAQVAETVWVDLTMDLKDVRVQGYACTLTSIVSAAPVEALTDLFAGGHPPQPSGRLSGGMGTGGGGGSEIQVAGMRAPLGTAQASFGGRDSGNFPLAAGQWLLVQTGVAGIDRTSFGDDDSWTLDVWADGAMRAAPLPTQPLACGNMAGLDGTTSVPMFTTGGSTTVKGPLLWAVFHDFGQSTGGDGTLTIAGKTQALPVGGCLSVPAWNAGSATFESGPWSEPEAATWMVAGALVLDTHPCF